MKTRHGEIDESAKEGVLSPDGRILLWNMEQWTAQPDETVNGAIRVYRPATNQLLYWREFDGDSADAVEFSTDGKHFVIWGSGVSVREAASGKESFCLPKWPANQEFALSPDAALLAVHQIDGRLRLWNVKTGALLHDLFCPYRDRKSNLFCNRTLEFSGDGQTLMVLTETTVRLWDVATGKERLPGPGHRAPITFVAFAADGQTLLSRSDDLLCRWNVKDAKETEHRVLKWRSDEARPFEGYSPDGRWFLEWTGAVECRFRGRTLFNKTESFRLHVRETSTSRVVCQLEGHYDNGSGFVFAPNSDQVLVPVYDAENSEYKVYNVASGKQQCLFHQTKNATAPVFSPDGRLLAWADKEYIIHLLDAATGKTIRKLQPVPAPGSIQEPKYLIFSPDGTHLACTAGRLLRGSDAVDPGV